MYPLTYNFKRIALTNKVTVTNASGEVILYAHQKLLNIKERILLFADVEKSRPVGELRADRVIDFSPIQTFTDNSGSVVSKVARRGAKSIWRANYEIMDAQDRVFFKVKEEKAWVKVVDALVGEIPIVGLFTGYLFNPTYLLLNEHEAVVGKITKRPSFLESNYTLELADQTISNAELLPISIMTVVTRERARG